MKFIWKILALCLLLSIVSSKRLFRNKRFDHGFKHGIKPIDTNTLANHN